MRGVFTALITPFNDRGELDLDAFRAVLKDQREAGVSGVVPCGTTGESPALSVDEKKALIQTALRELKGSGVQVIAGTGSNNTGETVALSRWASGEGAAGVLVVTPYYNKPSQAGLEGHFKAVADAVDCEVVLYNVPGRTGVSLTAETVARLAAHPKITTIKEATGSTALTSEIRDALAQASRPESKMPENKMPGSKTMDILSGDDATYLPLLAIGAVGVISVASGLFPRAMVQLQRAFDGGKLEEAREIHERYYPLFRDLFIESNPGPIKHAMASVGFGSARLRPPLAPLAASSVEKLDASLRRCGVTRGSRL